MPEVLALIPARGGSKGLLRKNLRTLQGHPLVAYAVAAGLQSKHVTRTICSTDDEEIAAVAQRYGAEVPFLRPAELAEDTTTDLPVFQHALHWLEEHDNWRPEIVIQLRPTSPIRFAGQVDDSVELLLKNPGATAVRSVCPAPCNPYKMWHLPEEYNLSTPYMSSLLQVSGIAEPYNAPRQALPPVWWQTGVIDAARSTTMLAGSMTGDRILPLKTDSKYVVDIDGEIGLRTAEAIMDGLDCIRPNKDLTWNDIKLLVLDVDGTLTPGTMYYGPDGEVLKRFHTHDGYGISQVKAIGVQVAIITTEDTPFATVRGQKLGIEELHTGVSDKLPVLMTLCARLGVPLRKVAYVGDDVGDLQAMKAVANAGGIPCAVADARPEIKAVALYQCSLAGGHGAVRDVCDLIVGSRR